MSKHQHGNREAKKPKRAQPPASPQPAAAAPARAAAAVTVAERPKRK